MNRFLLAIVLLLPTLGCRGVKRLLGNDDKPDAVPVQSLGGPAPLDHAPEFSVSTPPGFNRVVFYGELPFGGAVRVSPVPGSRVSVFMLDRTVNTWFALGTSYSDAFYFSYDATSGVVQYKGAHLALKAFCVYQYIPEAS